MVPRDACLVLLLIKKISAKASDQTDIVGQDVPEIDYNDDDNPNEKFQKAFDCVRTVRETTNIKRNRKKDFNLALKAIFDDQDTIIKRVAATIIEERYKSRVRFIFLVLYFFWQGNIKS